MKRVDRKRLEALKKVQDMAQVLTRDLEIASEEVIATKSAKPGKETEWEIAYAGKTVVRTLFSHVDVLAYTMRSIAVEYAQELAIQIPDQERLKLQELRGNKDGKPAPGRPTPIESLQIALQYFPALFGIEIDLDFSTAPAKAFLALAEIAKEMANPKTLEQLSGKDVDAFGLAGTAWYHKQVSDLFRQCAQQIPEAPPVPPAPAVPEYQHIDRSGEEGASSLRNPDHVKKAFEILKGDTSRAMGVSTKMAGKDDLQATHGQFGLRNLLRTVFSEADILIAIASFFLDLTLSDEEVADLQVRGDLDQVLLETMNLWSLEIGRQKQKEKGGKKWDMFRQALRYRDRVAHPRVLKELRVSLDETSIILGAQDWVRDLSELLDIDPERLPKNEPEQGTAKPEG